MGLIWSRRSTKGTVARREGNCSVFFTEEREGGGAKGKGPRKKKYLKRLEKKKVHALIWQSVQPCELREVLSEKMGRRICA